MTDRVLLAAGERAQPYKDAILELFKRLKSSRVDVQGMGRSLQKEKWDDLMYFLAQDYWMARLEKDTNKAVFSLAVMGFVRGERGHEARTRVMACARPILIFHAKKRSEWAGLGLAWRGLARPGLAWLCLTWLRLAWLGLTGLDLAWLGFA